MSTDPCKSDLRTHVCVGVFVNMNIYIDIYVYLGMYVCRYVCLYVHLPHVFAEANMYYNCVCVCEDVRTKLRAYTGKHI